MKRIVLFCLGFILLKSASAQDIVSDTVAVPVKAPKEKINLSGRANDHLLLQLGVNRWANDTDTLGNSGFPHTVNVYFLFDFPFKSNPKLSVAIGAGIGSDHVTFKGTYVDIKGTTSQLRFIDQSDTTHFKKTKLALTYLEAPVELRYSANPANPAHSFKIALGVKVGTLLNAHTRNKTLQDKNNNAINDFTMKESSKRYFNTTRIAGTARVGYGPITLFGSYQFTNLFKEGVAAKTNPYSIGLSFGGL